MPENNLYPQRFYDGFLGVFARMAASGMLPAGWFRDPLPPESQRRPGPDYPTVEIVTHCWQYASLLAYQLSSLINYPPARLKLIVTVFYAREDEKTARLLDFIGGHQVANIEWNWRPLPTGQLFRRGIGRNLAARETRADWVWMTDCDIVFHAGCWDSLADALQGKRQALLFPRQEYTTPMLVNSDPLLMESRQPQLRDIDTERFEVHTRDRAKGAFQIIHGDVARAIGYCAGLPIYQTPADHWCKCYEDRAFRWLVGTAGEPIDVAGVHQIRHIDKGRYRKDSRWSALRSWIRRVQE